ncbi:MAG: helix-turn-helix domain-containing protein [Thermoproteota archaeon]
MEEVNSKIEEAIIQALAHKARRNVLKIVRSSEGGVSYTELLNELGLPTGKLNYHLRQLEGLVEKTNEKKYVLTPFGEKAMSLLDSIV